MLIIRRTGYSVCKKYPDFDGLENEEIEEFLSQTSLTSAQKKEVLNSMDKSRSYANIVFWHTVSEAKKALRDYHIYLLKNGIFIEPKLRSSFLRLSDLIREAVVEHELNREHNVLPREFQRAITLSEEGAKLLPVLECDVQQRLWGSHPSPS